MGGGMQMPPGAAEQMRNMKPEDMARVSEEMKNMSPDQLKSQMNTNMNHHKAQADYALRGAEKLKTDGNKLVGEGKYKEAIEKYMRVKNNLAEDASAAAKTLRTSCMLNMSLCFNKSGRFASAISECTEVLKGDGRSLKAYYRRGQAHAAKRDFPAAVRDLRRAVKLSPGDETVKGELVKAVEDMKAEGDNGEGGVDDGECPDFEGGSDAGAGLAGAVEGAGAAGGGMGGYDMSRAAEMMKDPTMMAKAADMMENMSEEQYEAMSKNAPGGMGMPKMDPGMAKQAAAMMKNMDPEAMKGMMEMASSMQASGGMGTGPGGQPSPDMMANMAEQMKDPKMQEAMSSMMKNISPDQLKEMSSAAGMSMSDEQAAQTAKMMKDISPEAMQRMMKAGAFFQGLNARFRGMFSWASRNKTTAASLSVLLVSVLVSYVMRWGWFAKGAVDQGVQATHAAATGAANGSPADPEDGDEASSDGF